MLVERRYTPVERPAVLESLLRQQRGVAGVFGRMAVNRGAEAVRSGDLNLVLLGTDVGARVPAEEYVARRADPPDSRGSIDLARECLEA